MVERKYNANEGVSFSSLSDLKRKISEGTNDFANSSLIDISIEVTHFYSLKFDTIRFSNCSIFTSFNNCSFRKIVFQNCDLNELVFNNCEFEDISFYKNELSEVHFNNCKLNGVVFKDDDLSNVTFSSEKRQILNANFLDVKLNIASFSGFELEKLEITSLDIKHLILKNIVGGEVQIKSRKDHENSMFVDSSEIGDFNIDNFNGRLEFDDSKILKSKFNHCYFSAESSFRKTKFYGANFSSCELFQVDILRVRFFDYSDKLGQVSLSRFDNSILSQCTFESSIISGEFIGRTFEDCTFLFSKFRRSLFTNTNLDRISFYNQKLTGSIFENCKLVEANFTQTDVKGVKFVAANLTDADFSGASMDIDTTFENCIVEGMSIDNYSLASMKKGENSQFTQGNLMDMKVNDDLVKLRMTYSGAWTWIHLIAFLVWITPYIVYGIWLTWVSKPTIELEDEAYSYVITHMMSFIWSGTESAENVSNWYFIIVLVLVFYNLNRFILLLITKKFEMKNNASGIPVKFSLSRQPYRIMWAIAYYGFLFNLLLVATNTIFFMFRGVPYSSIY